MRQISGNSDGIYIVQQLIIQQKEFRLSLQDYFLINNPSLLPHLDIAQQKSIFNSKIALYKNLKYGQDNIDIISNLKKGTDRLFILSEELIGLHNRRLELNNQFLELTKIEQNIRKSHLDIIMNTKDTDIIASYYLLSNRSMEAIYQYKDSAHYDAWMKTIIEFENVVASKNIVQKEDFDAYSKNAENLSLLSSNIEGLKNEEVTKLSRIKESEKFISQLQEQFETMNIRNAKMIRENIIIFGLISILIAFLIVFILGYILAYYISKPISKIAQFAEKIGNGNYKERIKIDSDDEIGQTEKILNETLNKVEESKEILEIKVQARTHRLKDLTEELDSKVQEKTNKLNLKIKELEKFNNLAIDRELKMIDLKKEIKDLSQGNHNIAQK